LASSAFYLVDVICIARCFKVLEFVTLEEFFLVSYLDAKFMLHTMFSFTSTSYL